MEALPNDWLPHRRNPSWFRRFIDHWVPFDTLDRDLDLTVSVFAEAMLAAVRGAPRDIGANGIAQQALETRILAAAKSGAAGFADLMAVESMLAYLDHPDLALRRYWTTRERFTRVASAQAIAAYNRWSPIELAQPIDPMATTVATEIAGLHAAESVAADALATAVKAEAATPANNARTDAAAITAAALVAFETAKAARLAAEERRKAVPAPDPAPVAEPQVDPATPANAPPATGIVP